MRLRLILAFSLLALPALADPRSPQGRWWTQEHDGVINIIACGDALCGRIVGQMSPKDAQGKRSVDIHGQPECGLTILHGKPATDPGHWSGTITNPKDGHDWASEFWVGADGNLSLRGYLVVPTLGSTQVWTKFTGRVEADCSIASSRPINRSRSPTSRP